jgi:hypothetical protein
LTSFNPIGDGFGVTLLLALLMLLMHGIHAESNAHHFMQDSSPSIVQRLNYGVLFKSEGSLQFTTEDWLHTFQIKLPVHILKSMKRAKLRCPLNDTCSDIAVMLNHINKLNRDLSKFIRTTTKLIHQLLPKVKETEIPQGRTTRAWFPFIGDISKTVFGTATTQDVELLAQHIQAMQMQQTKAFKILSQHEEDISSFMFKSDNRINDLVKELNQTHDALVYLNRKFQSDTQNQIVTFNLLSALLSQTVQQHFSIRAEMTKFQSSILDLVSGKLPAILIPPNILSHSINEIQQILFRQFKGF